VIIQLVCILIIWVHHAYHAVQFILIVLLVRLLARQLIALIALQVFTYQVILAYLVPHYVLPVQHLYLDSTANLYLDSITTTCVLCNILRPNCAVCSYVGASLICMNCDAGYFVDGSGYCQACGTLCSVCTNPTTCTTCISVNLIISSGSCKCPLSGTAYSLAAGTCQACSFAFSDPGCIDCTSSSCILCSTGYILNSFTSVCQTCAVGLPNPGCIDCTASTCLSCITGYVQNLITTYCDPIICNSNEVLVGNTCSLCSTVYNSPCTQCDLVSCISCASGYFYNSVSNQC